MSTVSFSFPFAPHRWLRGAHAQTIASAWPVGAGSLLRAAETKVVPVDAHTELFAELDWAAPEKRPTFLLIHGLGGSSRSAYVVRARRFLTGLGFHVMSVTLRGSGPRAAPTRTLYHAGLTQDLTAALGVLEREDRVDSVALLGFSLGGHVALRLATQWHENVPERVKAVVSVSAPVDLQAVVTHLDGGAWWPPYRSYLLRSLLRNVKLLQKRWPEAVQLPASELGRLTTLRDYDDRVVAPMHGYPSAEAYYEAVSCGPALGQLRVPTLLVHAEDDPMVPWSTVKPSADAAGSRLAVAISQGGGHVGFFGNAGFFSAPPWPVRCAVDFFSSVAKKVATGPTGAR